ncbi:nucleotidyltransferase domain-containing protein [Ruania alba]|uniref:Nucleotidyltransferase domain-containing protein n=1 Tax=Ruania alba TaxID=648782 RepID=A0A1H5H0C5_9MICO|nr:nucleotidyltransferase domain-containing protein [Ruania alba]SEE21340.1 Nucleotidyltransferase domain-containing protein [Ruania alba]
MHFGSPFGGVIIGARGAVLEVLLRTSEPLTGRQIHALVSDDVGLWSVQEALKALTELGIVETHTAGRAGLHTINEDHVAVAPLRALVDPIAALVSTLEQMLNPGTQTALLFGSLARGEGRIDSDIDLAVISASHWDRRVDLQDAVRTRLGNECDVVVFTQDEFQERAAQAEPVVTDILRDGVALIGNKPRISRLAETR